MKIFERLKELKNYNETIQKKKEELNNIGALITEKEAALSQLNNDISVAEQTKTSTIESRDSEIEKTRVACQEAIDSYADDTQQAKHEFEQTRLELLKIKSEHSSALKDIQTHAEKVKLYKAFIRKAAKAISDNGAVNTLEIDTLCPTVELHLNALDVKDLKGLIKENQKLTDALLAKYEVRYTSKSNKAIYQLMVLALRAELQNILTDLKYSNIEKCKENLTQLIGKFYVIASDGNQQIAPTIKSFISEINILFEQAIDIEYTYYVRKEQEKAEQQALKEQMRQEAEERKALEAEQKKVEKEELKYKTEIANTEELIASCENDEKTKQLLARIEELKGLLEKVEEKKEDIINRQNGKAGYVYVISNLGSFGENRFKVGMTRRMEPMERIKELGDASVPFGFDVHSFIFSEDAVRLETELHNHLHKQRTNKINLRKEFFDVSLDDLEKLVSEICPSAEFKRTMLATEYRKGLEIDLTQRIK